MGGGTECSGSFSSSQKRKRSPNCHCGVEAPLVTSWTGDNPGRKFYGCGLFKVHGKRVCRFFVWYEYHGEAHEERCEEENGRDMKVICCLLKEIEAMKKKERVLEITLAICCVFIISLLFALVTK